MIDDTFDTDVHISELWARREEKDDFLGLHSQSPISPEGRDGFGGLDCFDPDPDYRVTASVETHADPEPMTMDASADGKVRYLRVATFRFEFHDAGLTLSAYRQEHDDSPTLFAPFRDKTTGQQTYDGGRYMEFTPNVPLDELGRVVIDFNLAYDPLCAFTETFGCSLPPEENWLDVVVPIDGWNYE